MLRESGITASGAAHGTSAMPCGAAPPSGSGRFAPLAHRRLTSARARLSRFLPALALLLGALSPFAAVPAAAQTELWSGTLTVQQTASHGDFFVAKGCDNATGESACFGHDGSGNTHLSPVGFRYSRVNRYLSPAGFSYARTDYGIHRIITSSGGGLTFALEKTFPTVPPGKALRLHVDGTTFQFEDADVTGSARKMPLGGGVAVDTLGAPVLDSEGQPVYVRETKVKDGVTTVVDVTNAPIRLPTIPAGSVWVADHVARWTNTGLSWSLNQQVALRLELVDLVMGGSGANPDPEPTDPLTASFEQVAPEHAGNATFDLALRLSETVGRFAKSPRPSSFEVTRGRVRSVEQVEAGLWRVRIRPASWREVTVTLAGGRGCDAPGAVCTPDGRALSNTVSATVGAPVRIQLKGGRAREGRDATLGFAVTLSRAAPETVSVDYATADGTATAGADYTAASGSLTFAPGETAKTVAVAILDEGKEKFYLRLSNPRGAHLRNMHREATGTIRNDDPLQAMWLARFGRMVASDAVGAVTGRLETPRAAPSHLTLAGQPLDLSGDGDGQALANAMTGLARAFGAEVTGPAPDDDPFAPPRLADPWNDPWNDPTAAAPRSMTGRELLLGTSFRAVLGQGAGSQWTSWGQGASVSHFSAAVPGLNLSGDAATGSMGMDYERGRLLAGFAMTHSVGEGTAHDAEWRYALGSTATMMVPYGRFALTERISAWGLAGTGSGTLTLDLDGAVAQRYRTDLAMTLAAVGARGDLLTPAEAGGFALALKADAFWVRTESDAVRASAFGNLEAARGDSSRMRAMLDGSRTFALAGGATLAPSVELGLRHDGGDAETGTGLELGAGLGYADPARGLDMALRVHGLAVHADDGYGEWGVSGSLRLVPGGSGRGLSASLTPSFGVDPGGSERLWALPASSGLAANGEATPSSRLDTELGYGLPVFGGGFTGTPNVGLGLSDAARDYRLGWRLTPAGASGGTGFELSVDATRREAANDNDAEHGVMVRSRLRW